MKNQVRTQIRVIGFCIFFGVFLACQAGYSYFATDFAFNQTIRLFLLCILSSLIVIGYRRQWAALCLLISETGYVLVSAKNNHASMGDYFSQIMVPESALIWTGLILLSVIPKKFDRALILKWAAWAMIVLQFVYSVTTTVGMDFFKTGLLIYPAYSLLLVVVFALGFVHWITRAGYTAIFLTVTTGYFIRAEAYHGIFLEAAFLFILFEAEWVPSRKPELPFVLYYDGDCGLCHRFIQLVLACDDQKAFEVASLNSRSVEENKINNPSIFSETKHSSMILVEGKKTYYRSTAALRIATYLGGGFGLLCGFYLIPRFIRDWLYSAVAANRHRFFPKQDFCNVALK